MKKLSTLIFIVKKFTGKEGKICRINSGKLLTESDEAPFSPSAGSIRRILDFARSYEVMNSRSTGQIEMVIN
jgi:hypothetical protein